MSDQKPTRIIAQRYRLEERIGQGGMGDVFRGVDIQTDEAVAIKRLKSDILEYEPSLIERFEREGEALRRLNHPNIVKMLAAIEEDGQHYLIMQYVPCGSLRDALEETPQMPVERVLAVGIELADALTRAHHLKIIHRDLKPANVLLDDDGTPLLTDFGVARLGTRTRVTESGAVIGTYAYLSPEACMGESLDGRADIWSFGVMLYEMLTGRRPFEAEQPTAILLAIMNNPVPDLTRLRPDVPPALAQLIGKMLEKKREDRVPSVRMVGAALEAISEGAEASLPTSLPLSGQPGDTGSRFASPTPYSDEMPLVVMGPPTGEHALPQPPPGAHYGPPTVPYPTGAYSPGQPTPTGQYPPGYTMTPYPAQSGSNMKWVAVTVGILAGAVLIGLVLLLVSGVLSGNSGDKDDDNNLAANPTAPPTHALPPTVPPPNTPVGQGGQNGQGGPLVQGPGNMVLPPDTTMDVEDVQTVTPVEAGEYMILVADLAPVSGAAERDVARLVANDLTDRLENEVPGSNLRVRHYPGVITTGGDAQLIGIVNEATVIVWGTYTDDQVDLHVALGVTLRFANLETVIFSGELERRQLESMVNVTVQLQDELTQSVAVPVLGVLTLLQTLDGDATEAARSLAIIAQLDVENGEIVSGGVAASLHQGLAVADHDPQRAISFYDQAIRLNGASALAYMLRASTYLRIGEVDKARRDITTAERLGPANWIMPLYLRGIQIVGTDDLDEALGIFDQIVAARPNDWFAYTYRGTLHFLQGDYESAQQDLDTATTLDPKTNFPYLGLVSLAIHAGDLPEAQAYLRASLNRFPDPSLSVRIGEVIFGEKSSFFGEMYAGMAYLTVGQYDGALQHVNQALAFGDQLPDLYLVQGIAYCALGEYDQADAAYSRGLELDPDFIMLYALRAEAGLQIGNSGQSAEDAQHVLNSDLGPTLSPVLDAALAENWQCGDFFDFDYNTLSAANDMRPPPATAPVATGDVVILVAPPEPLEDVVERDITRWVVDDLKQRLEVEIPFSFVQIQSYPDVITSTEQAQDVAQQVGAAIIVWGYYTPDYIEYTIELGSLQAFPYIEFPRDRLEQTINVRVRMENERAQSLALRVMYGISALGIADGSEYLYGLSLAMSEAVLDAPHAEVVGNSYASLLYKASVYIESDSATALALQSEAIDLDRGNPFGYVDRAMVYLIQGDTERFQSDMETARRLGSGAWSTMMGAYVMALDPEMMPVDAYDAMVKARPDDWYAYFARGLLTMYGDDPATARADLERSMSLHPRNSSPFLAATLLALREGRFADAQAYMETVVTQYPSPREIQDVMNVLMVNRDEDEVVGQLFSVMTLVGLGQYDDAAAEFASGQLVDLIDMSAATRQRAVGLMSVNDRAFLAGAMIWDGLAQCNLDDLAAAEQVYMVGLDFDPTLSLLYILRAQAREALDDADGAAEDWDAARANAPDVEDFDAWLDLAQQGTWHCGTFLDTQPTGNEESSS